MASVYRIHSKSSGPEESAIMQSAWHLLTAKKDNSHPPELLFFIQQEKTNYKSILYKTYFVMEYAVAHFDVRFVLKTDDDAFINIQPLIQQLKLLCETPDCQNERMYMVRHALYDTCPCLPEAFMTFDNRQDLGDLQGYQIHLAI